MIEIVIVGDCATSRARITEYVDDITIALARSSLFLSQVSIVPISPEEFTFRGQPSLIIVGQDAHSSLGAMMNHLRSRTTTTPVLVELDSLKSIPEQVERLFRLGATDTFTSPLTVQFLFRHLLDLEQKSIRRHGAIHLLDAGKGGIGCTGITAALGALISYSKEKVTVIDTDTFSQDLSRTLQAYPLVNHALTSLLMNEIPLTAESITHTITPSPLHPYLSVITPPVHSPHIFDSSSLKEFIHFCEALSQHTPSLLIDSSSLSIDSLSTLLKKATSFNFIVDRDPLSLPASVERLKQLYPYLSSHQKLNVIVNDSRNCRFNSSLIYSELLNHCAISSDRVTKVELPFNSSVYFSSSDIATLALSSSRKVQTAFQELRDLFLGTGEQKVKGPDSYGREYITMATHWVAEKALQIVKRLPFSHWVLPEPPFSSDPPRIDYLPPVLAQKSYPSPQEG